MTMKYLLAVALMIGLGRAEAAPAVPAPAVPKVQDEPLADDPMKVSVHRLKNGLTVYLSPNAMEPRVTAWISVRAGGKHDPADSTGMAHYLEHMLFKGSNRLGTLDYDKERPHLERISALYEKLFKTQDAEERRVLYAEIDAVNIRVSTYAVPNELDRLYKSIGFDGVNAFTSDERTVYVCNFPSNRTEVWARLESDRFLHPVFRLFQSEIETVYEEKNRSMDNAERILDEALGRQLFKAHPYGQFTVLGSIDHLKNPSLAKMYAYYDAHYRPNNMAITLSGDFDRTAMLALIERHFGAWEPRPLPPPKSWPTPAPKGEEKVEVKYEAEEQVSMAWLTVPRSHPDADALTVMDMVLDNSEAGILNLTLEQAQKVKSAGSYPEHANDAGSWTLWAVTKKGQTLEEARALLLETVDKLKAGEFTDDDLKAIITDFEVREKYKIESNDARAAAMADSFASFEEWDYARRRLERLRAVTKADVLRVARRYLGPDRVAAYRREGKPEIPSIQKPSFAKIPIEPTRQSAFFKELESLPAVPLEPRWIVEGKNYALKDHPWGRLYASKNPMNDLFSLSFSFDRGRRHARRLCAAIDLLDLSGAGDMTAEEFKKGMYGLGTTMSLSCGEDGAGVALSGLDANFEKSLELMFKRFEAPRIASDTLKKMIEVQIGAHRDNKKDPGAIHYALSEYASRGRESSVLTQLTDKELEALDEKELRGLLRGFFDYERDVLYVGVREPGAVAHLLSAGRPRFKPEPKPVPRRYLRPPKPRLIFTHRDMVQSRVGVYAADTVMDPQETVDYLYYNTYMGGMSGVIFQEVREARSLAYSAKGGYSSGGRKGDENYVWASAGCQADKTVEATALLRALLLKMPASESRFREARKSVEESYRTDVINFRQAPGTVLYWVDLGLPPKDPRPERFKRALAYTMSDLAGFAKRFEDKALSAYILGHKERVKIDALKDLGAFEEKTLDDIFPY